MTTAKRWIRAVEEACAEPDPVRSNQSPQICADERRFFEVAAQAVE
jgi:hypothetical protein